jgi:hypothetical protein
LETFDRFGFKLVSKSFIFIIVLGLTFKEREYGTLCVDQELVIGEMCSHSHFDCGFLSNLGEWPVNEIAFHDSEFPFLNAHLTYDNVVGSDIDISIVLR